MGGRSVIVSARPDRLGTVAGIANGVEVKLDWEHFECVLADGTVSDACRKQGVPGDAVASVHLPPGTNRRYGMAVAPGNVGTISDFTHTKLGDDVAPEWLTVHTARSFDYREHIDRLATITGVTGYPVAVENTPDASHLHAPESLAFLAFLIEKSDRLADTSLLVDTAHVDRDRRAFELDDRAIADVLDRLDAARRGDVESALREYVTTNLAGANTGIDERDPYRPVLTTLHAAGGNQIRAIHLNDPVDDGLPTIGHDVPEGLFDVLDFCDHHDVTVVLEPGDATVNEIADVVQWLANA